MPEVPSDKMTSAPATMKDDGDDEGEVRRDDDAGPAPVIEVGNAVVPVVDDLPLGNDGKRDLKAEAVSLEHMMTHTPFNGQCPHLILRPCRLCEGPAANVATPSP